MKKFAFIAATALVTLASCSNTDELMTSDGTQSAKQAITFESPFVNKNTRASEEVTSENIKNKIIAIWGFSYSDEEGANPSSTVIGTDNGDQTASYVLLSYNTQGYWSYDKIAYWEKNKWYDFAAVCQPASTNLKVEVSQERAYSNLLKVGDIPCVQEFRHKIYDSGSTNEGPSDIMVANVYGHSLSNDGSTVNFNLKHILSRLNVYVYRTIDSKVVTLKSLKLYLPSSEVKYSYNLGIHGKDALSGYWEAQTSQLDINTSASSAADLSDSYKCYTVESNSMTVGAAANAAEAISNGNSSEENLAVAHLCRMGYYIAPVEENLNEAVYLEATYSKAGDENDTEVSFKKIGNLKTFQSGMINNLVLRINGEGKEPISFEVSASNWDGQEATSDANGTDVK